MESKDPPFPEICETTDTTAFSHDNSDLIQNQASDMFEECDNSTQVEAAVIQIDTKSPQKDGKETYHVLPFLKGYRIPKRSVCDQGNRLNEASQSDESNKTFGQLKMANLEVYGIPEYVWEIEFDNNQTNLDRIEQMARDAATDELSYLALNTALIHLEEAANSRKVQIYDLKNIQLKLHSRIDKIFELECGELNPNLSKAVRDAVVKEFTLKPINLAAETNGLILNRI